MERDNNKIFNILKNNNNSIITAFIVICAISFYLLQIIPQNEKIYDLKNFEELNNIENQLNNYLSNKLNGIDSLVSRKLKMKFKNIKEVRLKDYTFYKNKLSIKRKFLGDTLTEKNRKDTIDLDSVELDFYDFIHRLEEISVFENFYIGLKDTSNKKQNHLELASNIPVQDADSLKGSKKNQELLIYKDSKFRYYSRYVRIKDHTLFLAAGVSNDAYEETIREINPKYLIFFLFITIILFLSINLIKPVLSSNNERLSQKDLVSVTLTIGGIVAISIIYSSVLFWKNTFKNETYQDAKVLNDSINKVISSKLDSCKIFLEDEIKESDLIDFKSKKIDSLKNRVSLSAYEKKLCSIIKSIFKFDSKGLITADWNDGDTIIPRIYKDRNYFKQLRANPTDVNYVLTSVYGREDNNYQLIFARNQKESKDGIIGIVLKEDSCSKVKPPNGMDYMVFNDKGDIILHSNPKQNLYQNVSNLTIDFESVSNAIILKKPFNFEYIGKESVGYVSQLDSNIVKGLYILTTKDQSYLNSVSVFTFSNAAIFSIMYGLFLFVITFIMSNIMHAGKIGLFSRYHLYYLFPDNSRKYEYKMLFNINLICIIFNLLLFIFLPINISLIIFSLFAFNIASYNFIFLSCRFKNLTSNLKKYGALFLAFGILVPAICIHFNLVFLAIFVIVINWIIALHFAKKWREDIDINSFVSNNIGIQSKRYSKFVTVIIVNQFLFFSIIVSTYIFHQQITKDTENFCSTFHTENNKLNSYGCSCLKDNNKGNFATLLKDFEFPKFGIMKTPSLQEKNSLLIKKESYINIPSINNYLLYNSKILIVSIIVILIITLIVYKSIQFYSNRFFFFDLMQASYLKYYPFKSSGFANNRVIPVMVNNYDILNLKDGDEFETENAIPIGEIVSIRNEIFNNMILDESDLEDNVKIEFILNQNLIKFEKHYNKIWNSFNNLEKSVLFDFAQDHFVNYKNKDILMKFMEQGIILTDALTGRLRMMSLSFRVYIMTMSKRDDEFVAKFEKESKNGSYSKLKTPIIIVSLGLLVLLMYLNKESYDRIFIFSSSLGSVVILLNRFLDFNKKTI
jgi:hypothetical protein